MSPRNDQVQLLVLLARCQRTIDAHGHAFTCIVHIGFCCPFLRPVGPIDQRCPAVSFQAASRQCVKRFCGERRIFLASRAIQKLRIRLRYDVHLSYAPAGADLQCLVRTAGAIPAADVARCVGAARGLLLLLCFLCVGFAHRVCGPGLQNSGIGLGSGGDYIQGVGRHCSVSYEAWGRAQRWKQRAWEPGSRCGECSVKECSTVITSGGVMY